MFNKLHSRVHRNLTDKSNWLSFIAGLMLVFAYAPFSLWWLPFIALSLWFYHLEKLLKSCHSSAKKVLSKHSLIFAFGWFASGISWVHVSIAEFGGLPLMVTLLLMMLLCLYLALFPALCGYLTVKFSRFTFTKFTLKKQGHEKANASLWLFPSFWLLTEYLRGTLLTGFPWLSLGYSQIDGPLAPLAPIIGEVGITFCLLMVSVSCAKLFIKPHRKYALFALIIISGFSVYAQQTSWLTVTDKTIKTALVQGNIAQSIKWQPEQQWPTMLTYLDLTRTNYDAKLIIWPESAIPAIETMSTTQEFLEIADQSATLNNATIITGIINYNFESKEYFNSLIVLGKSHKADDEGSYFYNNRNRYYKNHLLPIGEFVPFGDLLRPLAPLFNLPMSSFTRGNYTQNNLLANDLRILPLICFEIAFPQQLAANFSPDSNVLLTVSNDAWFGNSHGPHQHMEIARMRALEFGRPLLRSTNTGVTAVTDHLGNITHQAPQFEQTVLKADIVLVEGITPYSRFGNFPIWLFAFIFSLVIFFKNKFSQPSL